MVKLRYKLLGGILLAMLVYVYVRNDDARHTYTLPRDGAISVVSTPTRITTVSKTGTKVVPNYGHGVSVEVTPTAVIYKPIAHGYPLTPGFSTDFKRVGLAIEVGFYKRLSLIVGSNFFDLRSQQWDVRIFGALAYRLPWARLDNISLYTGVDNTRRITGGVFVRFGGN